MQAMELPEPPVKYACACGHTLNVHACGTGRACGLCPCTSYTGVKSPFSYGQDSQGCCYDCGEVDSHLSDCGMVN